MWMCEIGITYLAALRSYTSFGLVDRQLSLVFCLLFCGNSYLSARLLLSLRFYIARPSNSYLTLLVKPLVFCGVVGVSGAVCAAARTLVFSKQQVLNVSRAILLKFTNQQAITVSRSITAKLHEHLPEFSSAFVADFPGFVAVLVVLWNICGRISCVCCCFGGFLEHFPEIY